MGNKLGRKKVNKEEVLKHYKFNQTIGRGSFAKVKECVRRSDNKVFAVKIVDKEKLNEHDLNSVYIEIEILRTADHPNVTKFIDLFETKTRFYIVMELLTGGVLFDRIIKQGSFSEEAASKVVRDVCVGLQYLHGIGVVHRDLKPENLIYANEDPDAPIKITDFGLAKILGPGIELKTACGTASYVAPEVLKLIGYNEQCDMWSLGVILYVMLSGYPPFYHKDQKELYRRIKAAKYSFSHKCWKTISDEAKDLIRGLLVVDPRKRMTVEEVMSHPWVRGSVASPRGLGVEHQKRMRQHVARRRLRRAVQTVIAINKMRQAARESRRERDELSVTECSELSVSLSQNDDDDSLSAIQARSSSANSSTTPTPTAASSSSSSSSSAKAEAKEESKEADHSIAITITE